jgi:hypothetical protein
MQKAQSPNWAWVARTGDTSGAPVSFVVLKAVLTSSASAFSSGGTAAARTGDADSFTSSPAQPVTAKHTSTVNIGDTDNLSLPNDFSGRPLQIADARSATGRVYLNFENLPRVVL